MNDSEVIEGWLTQVFAQVEAPPGVAAWRDPAPRRNQGNGSRNLRAISLTAGIAMLLFIASVAGTLALTHSHPSSKTTTHPRTAPAATQVASPPAQAVGTACSQPLATVSPYPKAFLFYPAGAAELAISCQRAIATLLCPPVYGGGPCLVFPGVPVQAELVRVSSRTSVGEVRGRGFPFIGPPFVPNKLLVWRLVWVPTVCNADGTGVSGSDAPVLSIFSTEVSTPCRVAFDYLIDASTGNFVLIDDPPN